MPDLAQDPDRERALGAGREGGHDHLVEGKSEGEYRARHHRRRDERQRDVSERLKTIRSEVHRRFQKRALGAAQAREHVVIDDHDAERRVADDDRAQR